PSTFYFKKKTAYEIHLRLVDSEMCRGDSSKRWHNATQINAVNPTEKGHLDLFVLPARGEKA
ncbi:hypothetical protein V6E04_20125, partial [Serratia marcescens]